MKKKIILIVIIVIIAFILGVVLSPQIRNQIKIIKGYTEFGNKYCEGDHSSYSGPVTTQVIYWACPICGKDIMQGNGGPHPEICYQCSELTGRCSKCGRILSNTVSKEDRIALENYISEKYDLYLKIIESSVEHRGNIGDNPGVTYYFVLNDKDGWEYRININRYVEMDLKSILAENADLDVVQMK